MNKKQYLNQIRRKEKAVGKCLMKNCVREADGVDDIPLCSVCRKNSIICKR